MVRFLLALLVAGGTISCTLGPDPRPSDRVTVASWNVQNLFDEVDDGTEYPEFDPERGWTRGQFWARCQSLARVVRTLAPTPDVFVFQELEGLHSLDVFLDRFLPDLGYRHRFLAPDSLVGVKIAIVSRFPFARTALHYPATTSAEILRPLVEVEVDLGGRPLVVIGNHWKSRIPTPAATEGHRRDAAALLARRIQVLEDRPDRPWILALGDFNTSLELSRSRPDRALVPALSATANDLGLPVFAHRDDVSSVVPRAVWDPWETVSIPPGSYVYQGDWDRLDHAFVAVSSLRLSDWVFDSFQVVAYAETPQPWSVRTPQGISDHFPLVVSLRRR